MYNLFKLNNGLRVVLENIDYVNSVSVGLWVENGSRNEDSINNGISHFIEHMFFKGTENRTALQIAECIEDVGGQINAFTGKEATCFYIKALDSHLELALDVIADMLFNSKFLAEDIEREKGVIIEEIKMSEDSPEDVLADLHSSAIWGEDSLSLPILGTVETIKSFNREQIVEYISSHYIPENSVISISGNFDCAIVEKLVEKYFGNWNSKNKKVTNYSNPSILTNHLYKKKSIEQLHLSLGIPGIESGKDNLYALLLLSNVLGGGASSILFQKIREEKGLCYSVYSYISSFRNTGIVSIYTSLNPQYAADALSMIKDELDKFIKTSISDEKIHKAKEQLKGSYILGLESTSSRMFNNGKSVLFLNRINNPKDIIEKINNIDKYKLNEVMKNTFEKGILNAAFVGEEVNLELLSNIINKDFVSFKNSRSELI
ncbi:M16 family metallopeptidase [Clostridium thailandense]|uniref:Insulinase family protein n=1 Tax=Clostridium thailandense TaxID=2794346 RepID=A0A949TYF7_9CLOT|nr:pitrilysin family protein [Clostridium thailandense]MBV7274913.1 insulinase family protein [Clostridium thailandense]